MSTHEIGPGCTLDLLDIVIADELDKRKLGAFLAVHCGTEVDYMEKAANHIASLIYGAGQALGKSFGGLPVQAMPASAVNGGRDPSVVAQVGAAAVNGDQSMVEALIRERASHNDPEVMGPFVGGLILGPLRQLVRQARATRSQS